MAEKLDAYPYGALEIICDDPRASIYRDTERLQALVNRLCGGGYSDLKSVTCRLDPDNFVVISRALSDMTPLNGKGVRYAGVGVLELLQQQHNAPAVTYEHRAIARTWSHLAALHPDAEQLSHSARVPAPFAGFPPGTARLVSEVRIYLQSYYKTRERREAAEHDGPDKLAWAEEAHCEEDFGKATEYCVRVSRG